VMTDVLHQCPTDLETALAACAEGYLPYCGATELVPALRMGLMNPDRIVSLRKVAGLSTIRRDSDGLFIGGTATHLAVSQSEDVRDAAPYMAEVAEGIGNIRVRAAGTVGGNLAFAEPRSDWITLLSALAAQVHLEKSGARRSVEVEEFIEGPYGTVMDDDEILTGVTVPTNVIEGVHYEKFVGSERPIVAAALARVNERWRVAIGAVGDEVLLTESTTLDAIDVEALAQEVDVVPDLSGGERYRRHLAALALQRCVNAATAEGATDSP
jgi:aerobic carbon-monoxide dehydrogenase medium subunit